MRSASCTPPPWHDPDVDTRIFHPPTDRFHSSQYVPGDKSLSHRALLLAAMAEGSSQVSGVATGAVLVTSILTVAAALVSVPSLAVNVKLSEPK